MPKRNCIFCKISEGSVPAFKIYEDKNYIAILDIFPNIKGQTLVIPKKHLKSYAFALSDMHLSNLIKVSKKVARRLENGLRVRRVHMVLEGLGVDHLHAKLYPAMGIKQKKFRKMHARERVRFERYEGYVTTLLGPRATDIELTEVQKEILNRNRR